MNACKSRLSQLLWTTSCHNPQMQGNSTGLRTLILVGAPNVGKSVTSHALTGVYVTVSNYPGTTVETARGKGWIENEEFAVMDTPGLYSLLPITEEERVTRTLLFTEKPAVVIQVVDAKNLERMLPLTLQLIAAGFPVILNLNIIDEAEQLGIRIDREALERELGIPVVATIATSGKGIDSLQRQVRRLTQSAHTSGKNPLYENTLEESINEIVPHLKGEYPITKRAIALLLLQQEHEMQEMVKKQEGENYATLEHLVQKEQSLHNHPLSYLIALNRQQIATSIVHKVVTTADRRESGLAEKLSWLTLHPLTGIPIMFLVLYYGLYQFVGIFGAGTLVDFIEGNLFAQYINPWVNRMAAHYIPWEVLRSLVAEEYGIITLGIRYAIAIILPIVGTFFLTFSLIEDSGYLPRIALLVDLVFKRIGLNGRAVIPMTPGFGCGTMATMVTRTLETAREKVIATLLLALAIPCSAQLGVILALLTSNGRALWVWALVVTIVFLFIGFLTARLLPGERPSFYMEIPPLRWPKLSNVFIKTYARIQWYFLEVFPLFIGASILIWFGKLTGGFDLSIDLLKPLVRWMGLPDDTAVAFLFGFFRRDYGIAGLYDLQRAGEMSGNQLVVAAVTLTLFVPCVAQFSMMLKERGAKITFAIIAFIFPFAFTMGYLLNLILNLLRVQL